MAKDGGGLGFWDLVFYFWATVFLLAGCAIIGILGFACYVMWGML